MLADGSELMLRDSKLVQELVAQDRTLGERIAEWIRKFVQKLHELFGDSSYAEARAILEAGRNAQELWDQALKNAVETHNAIESKNTVTEGGEAQYSLRDVNGKQIAWIENSGLTNKQLADHQAVADYIADHIGDVYTIIESGQKVYIGEEMPHEYTQSRYTKSILNRRASLNAKNRALSGLQDMIEIATNRRWEKTKHPGT